MPPEDCRDELEECDDVEGSILRARGLAVEKEVQQLQAYWVSLHV